NTMMASLDATANAEDPTRLSLVSTDAIDAAAVNWKTDLTAFNKYFGWYYGALGDFGKWMDVLHATYPTRCIGIGEYGAGGSINQHAVPPVRPRPADAVHPEEYENLVHESHWLAVKDRKFLWCKFTWCLFDFAVDGRHEGELNGRND